MRKDSLKTNNLDSFTNVNLSFFKEFKNTVCLTIISHLWIFVFKIDLK
jgi:hypothetical protein